MASTERHDPLNLANGVFIDDLYQQWRDDPSSVDADWHQFFRGFELGAAQADDEQGDPQSGAADVNHGTSASGQQWRVDNLIYHYRDIGHLAATIDPLGKERPVPERLDLNSFGLSEADLGEQFDPGTLPLSSPTRLDTIVDHLQRTYCRNVGVEYMHIQDPTQRRWLQERMEEVANRPTFGLDQKMRILRELIEADALESFLDRRYTGKKRFSIQGSESLIPVLNEIIDLAPSAGVREYTFGMAHRGRLNVLVNILNKTYAEIFTEFSEAWTEDFIEGGGDVKYHRGYSSDHKTFDGTTVRLTLSPNPSHLEYVGPVVLGRARAKQRLRGDTERIECVPILIHGDGAFPGQGVVAETLNLVGLDGYTVGGTLHVIINNQVGFTTDPRDLFSGRYCTDIAKMTEAPIFHINGDDPEACVFAGMLALQFRQAFKTDVVIDLWGYRKYGHNEGDEPAFTQPAMYRRIREQTPVTRLYADRLIAEGDLTAERYDELTSTLAAEMDEAQERSKASPVKSSISAFGNVWSSLSGEYTPELADTSVTREVLLDVSAALGTVPDSFTPHKKLKRLLAARGNVIENDGMIDWAMGELFAYGTLLLEGHPVRLTGQDVERGTFSHRHVVLIDQEDGSRHDAINHIRAGQARMCIHNSPLSESACVGFEYGYSLGDPNMLVIWEAQFGDFANGAQVFFDQFIASAEIKWRRFTGLTVFLPHGYEGQGPEHSSARLERFLTLCADDNMIVAYPTTPAQIFHLLRNQMKHQYRKPMIVMTPKSLLRHPQAVSPVSALTDGQLQRVIDDPTVDDPASITRVLLCSGKVYYDLIAHRAETDRHDVAIVRLEQIYPLPTEELKAALGRYPASASRVWVQEEPRNMGAWRFLREVMPDRLDVVLSYVGRDENASPAVASQKMHLQEQKKLMIDAIGLPTAHQATSSDTLAATG